MKGAMTTCKTSSIVNGAFTLEYEIAPPDLQDLLYQVVTGPADLI
jgi:hypothetical protein